MKHKIHFCKTCSLLLGPAAGVKKVDLRKHDGHDVVRCLSRSQLQHPTKLLLPASHRRQNAQYFFSHQDTAFVLEKIRAAKAKRVVCLGCPSIHEAVLSNTVGSDGDEPTSSLLLDLDPRFAQFFPSSFARFNMLTTFFFDRDDQERTRDFLRQADFLVVDPPFGCPISALAHAIHWVHKCAAQPVVPTLLFFPYFSAPALEHALPDFRRSNYCVSYINHKTYVHAAPAHVGVSSPAAPASRKPSPVRIFTNIDLASFALPTPAYRCV